MCCGIAYGMTRIQLKEIITTQAVRCGAAIIHTFQARASHLVTRLASLDV